MKITQRFDSDRNLFCVGCDDVIGDDALYIEVRQRNFPSCDARLACHVECVAKLAPLRTGT